MGAYVYTMRSDSQDAYATDGSHAKIGRTAYAGKPYGYDWQDAYGEDRYAKACNGEIRKAVGVAKRVFARRPPPKLYVVGDEDDTPFGPFAPFAQVHGEWEESRRWSYDTVHPVVGWLKPTGLRSVPWGVVTNIWVLERYHLGCPDARFNGGPGTPCSQEARGDGSGTRTNTHGERESYVAGVERARSWTREAAERIAARWHRQNPLHGVVVTHYCILPEVNPETGTRWQQQTHLLYEAHQIPRCNAHTSPPPPPPLTADERLGAAFDHFVATLEPTC